MGDTTAIVTSHRDTDGASLTITRNDSPMIELGTALEKHLHFQEDVQEGAKNNVPASESTQICLQKVETCLVLKIHRGGDCMKTHGSLTKSATFPSSGKALSSALDGSSEALDMAPHGQSARKYESPSYTRSTSMPTPVKLVSAMKGGREQKGTPLLLKMNVTWAPDVHDPPATSLSHTVKSHHQYQRPKAKKKKDQKQKRKGKSARGSSNEKKHQDNSSVGGNGHMQLRPQSSGSKSASLDGLDQPTEENLNGASSNRSVLLDGCDYQSEVPVSGVTVVQLSVSRMDSKCGSSFRASLAKLHVPLAEAT
eukprot:TRINITY_DN1823_c0_g1_i2.p1 TRINITY_DN1823_c0_g1~~TRINITY_DN1823_c0_g1_i2.p1  ORF type:complete len:310 (+),score=67.09 TRINITY_DN1823_c0_g1_i2:870-1799(+)